MAREKLKSVDGSTPHTFRIRLSANAELSRAALVLEERLGDELTFQAGGGSDAAVFDVQSTFSPRTAAVARPLNVLRRAGIAVDEIEFTDLFFEPRPRELRKIIAGWAAVKKSDSSRRRAAAVAGPDTLQALRELLETNETGEKRSAVRFVFGCAAYNTAGSERLTLRLAREESDAGEAAWFIDMAARRADLCRLAKAPFEVDESDLIALVSRSDYAGELAIELLQVLPGPHSPELRAVLVEVASAGRGERAVNAIYALRWVEPTEALRACLDELLRTGDTAAKSAALYTAAGHWGEELRPTWNEFLQSRSALLRESAEAAIGTHGTAEDLELAADHLAKLIRRKPGAVSYDVPRGAEIIDLMRRHPDEPSARQAIDDLCGRWDRLHDDMRDWLAKSHPDLGPRESGTSAVDDQIEPEEALLWPLPSIEQQEDGTYIVNFEQTDMFETKDRFTELISNHPDVSVFDAERELLYLNFNSSEPNALVAKLWQDSGGEAAR